MEEEADGELMANRGTEDADPDSTAVASVGVDADEVVEDETEEEAEEEDEEEDDRCRED